MVEQSRVNTASARLLEWLGERVEWAPQEPTPVDALARALGVSVETYTADLNPGSLGYLEPGEDLIFLRAGLPETLRRFTLAHEIGHVVLHRNGPQAALAGIPSAPRMMADEQACGDDDFDLLDEGSDEALRPGQAYSARAMREREANVFAATLLMPREATISAYQAICASESQVGPFVRRAQLLSERFGVSEDVALRRLQSLLAPESGADLAATPTNLIRPTLDDEQIAATRMVAPALVTAGPGAGKTATLIGRVIHLIEDQGVSPQSILVMTFSRKATEELQLRLAQALGDAPIPTIATIHGFCGELLRSFGSQVGLRPDFRLITQVEGYFLLRDVMMTLSPFHLMPLSAPTLHFSDILREISRAKDNLHNPSTCVRAAELASSAARTPQDHESASRLEEFAQVFEAYQRALETRGDADYGDIIALAARLLREQPDVARDVRERYSHVLVDEYQDINRAMAALLRELVMHTGALWAVGDADQAIYRFRGASPESMAHFARDHEGAKRMALLRNYRSRPEIVDIANAFAAEFLPEAVRFPVRSARDSGSTAGHPTVDLVTTETDQEELDELARLILAQKLQGRPFREQAVLMRSRRQVEQVSEGLAARGVAVKTLTAPLEREAAKDLLAITALVSDPFDAALIRAGRSRGHAFCRDDALVLAREARQRGVAPLDLAIEGAPVTGISSDGMLALRSLARIVMGLREAPSVATGLARYLFSWTDMGARFIRHQMSDSAEDDGAALAIKRLLDLARMYDDWSVTRAPERGVDWARFIEYTRIVTALRSDLVQTADIGEAEDWILVLTVHASKGLEFPVVYLPQLANRRFPVVRRAGIVPSSPRLMESAQSDNDNAYNDNDDEAALFYVAVTRARDQLVMSYARRYGKALYKSSPFLQPFERLLASGSRRVSVDSRDQRPRVTGTSGALEGDDAALGDTTASPDQEVSSGTIELSAIENYLRCPRQYAYRHVDGFRSTPGLLGTYSRVMRDCADELASRFRDAREEQSPLPDLAEARELVMARWEDAIQQTETTATISHADAGSVSEDLRTFYARHARRSIDELWRLLTEGNVGLGVPDSSLRPYPGERHLTVNIGGCTVSGNVDVVESEVATVTARDVGEHGVTGLSHVRMTRLQVGRLDTTPTVRDLFYTLAAEAVAHGGEPITVMKRSLSSGATEMLHLTDRQRSRLEKDVASAVAGMRAGGWTPKPEPYQCAQCPYALACPE